MNLQVNQELPSHAASSCHLMNEVNDGSKSSVSHVWSFGEAVAGRDGAGRGGAVRGEAGRWWRATTGHVKRGLGQQYLTTQAV